MKNVLIAALLGLGLAHGSAFAAGSAAQNFTVSVSLTPACALGAVTPVSFTYTGMQTTAAVVSGGSFTIQCTGNLPYSFSLDADAGGSPGTYVDSATLLNYTLTAPAAGTGDQTSHSLSLNPAMPANQPGSCPTGSTCTNGAGTTRTLTVTY